MANEVDDKLRKLDTMPGVKGAIVMNWEGIPIKSSLDNDVTVQYAAMFYPLAEKALRIVKELNPLEDNYLKHLRIRTPVYEIVIAADKDYVSLCIQEPTM